MSRAGPDLSHSAESDVSPQVVRRRKPRDTVPKFAISYEDTEMEKPLSPAPKGQFQRG